MRSTRTPSSCIRAQLLNFNNNATASNYNRWADSVAINLDGATLAINSLNNVNAAGNVEDVGAITYGRGAVISVARTGTGSVALRTPSFTRTNNGTVQILTGGALGTLAIGTASSENLIAGTVNGLATNVTASGNVNGMLPAYFVNGTANTFVTYGANGFANTAFTGGFSFSWRHIGHDQWQRHANRGCGHGEPRSRPRSKRLRPSHFGEHHQRRRPKQHHHLC